MPATKVKTKWSSGNLLFTKTDGSVIMTVDGTNRAINIPTGATLTVVDGIAGTMVYGLVGDMAAAGTSTANAVGVYAGAARTDHVHAIGDHDHSGATKGGNLGAVTVGAITGTSISLTGDIDMSASTTTVYDLILKENQADALSIKTSAADMIVFNTTTGSHAITITPATTISGALTVSTGGITVGAGGITVTGTSIVTGAFTVTGTLTTGALTFSGQLTASAGIDMNGTELILDADADSSITADTNNQIDFKLNGTDYVSITTTKLDINALELVLDANADTSITADTDNQIDFKINNADDFQMTANTFTVLSGSTLSIASGGAMSATGTITVIDDSLLSLGTGSTARLSYDTTDANANCVMLQLPATAGADVPVIAIGQSIESVDLTTYDGTAHPTMVFYAIGASTTGNAIDFRKARGTIAAPTVVTTGDDAGYIRSYICVANGEWVQNTAIELDSAGTIQTTRGPGVIRLRTATDVDPSVLTTALTIDSAQLVTLAAGLTVTTGAVTVTSGNVIITAGDLDLDNQASDILMKAATAAALEVSDSTTKYYAFDTRVATAGVITHALDISDYTIASAAGNVETGWQLAAHTLNYTGNTQVTTQVDTMVVGARTIVADGVGGSLTVDELNTLLLVAPLEGVNAILTAASALRIVNAGGTPVNQYGLFIEDLTVGATLDVGIYLAGADSAAIYVAADPIHVADNVKVGFGSGTGVGAYDASIYYDGTNLVINPKDIGTGVVTLSGGMTIGAGLAVKSDGAAEIGITVDNSALTVGSAGSIKAPYLASTAAAFTDPVGGDQDGCIGANYDTDTGPTPTFEVRINGTWYSTAVAGVEIQGKTSGGSKRRGEKWHDNQLLGDNFVDETICVKCGQKMKVGDKISLYANYERNSPDGSKNLHAVFCHADC